MLPDYMPNVRSRRSTSRRRSLAPKVACGSSPPGRFVIVYRLDYYDELAFRLIALHQLVSHRYIAQTEYTCRGGLDTD